MGMGPGGPEMPSAESILRDCIEARAYLHRTALTEEEKLTMVTVDDPEWPPWPGLSAVEPKKDEEKNDGN
jgi:hypothetical protein